MTLTLTIDPDPKPDSDPNPNPDPDLSKEWITEAEAKEANKEYKWMHDKGWAAGRGQ